MIRKKLDVVTGHHQHLLPRDLLHMIVLFADPWPSAQSFALGRSLQKDKVDDDAANRKEPERRWDGQRYESFLRYRVAIVDTPVNRTWTPAAMSEFYRTVVEDLDQTLTRLAKWFRRHKKTPLNMRYIKQQDPRALESCVGCYHVLSGMKTLGLPKPKQIQLKNDCMEAELSVHDIHNHPLLRTWEFEPDSWIWLEEFFLQYMHRRIWKACTRAHRLGRQRLVVSDFG